MESGSLEERIGRLEADNRRLRAKLQRGGSIQSVLAVLVVSSFVPWFVAGRLAPFVGLVAGTPESTVSARDGEFVFRNEQGSDTILLDNDKFGSPILGLIDRNKNMRMHVKADGEAGAPSIQFFGQGGARIELTHRPDGRSVLEMKGADQKGGIFLAVAPDGTPSLRLTDRDGAVIFEAPSTSGGSSAAPSGP